MKELFIVFYHRVEQYKMVGRTLPTPGKSHPDLIHPRNWPKPSQFFHSKLKHCSLSNPILIHHLPHTPSPSQLQALSTIATIASACQTVCLSDSLDLDPLPIDFVLVKRMWISWFPRLRFCGRCRNLEFTTTIRKSETAEAVDFNIAIVVCFKINCKIIILNLELIRSRPIGYYSFA